MSKRAYKLLRLRKDGTLGPLFINRRQVIQIGRWLHAEAHRTPGFAFRPGWHVCHTPHAPHLSERGRVWCEVRVDGIAYVQRPQPQGGLWLIAQHMKVVRII